MVIFSVLTRCFIRYRNCNFKTPWWNKYTDSESIVRNNEFKTVWQEQSALLFPQLRQPLPHTDQFISLGSQYNGYIPPIILIHSSPGQLNQVRKKPAQRLGVLGPLLNRRSSLSIRNGVLLYKQLLHPMIECAGTVWWSTAHSHIRKLQVLQSKCLQIATSAPWYSGNKQIHDDMGLYSLPTTSDLWEVRLKLADMGNPLVTQLSWYLHWPSVGPGPLKQVDCDRQLVSVTPKGGHVATLNRAHLALFNYPDWGFPCFFLQL